MVAAVAAPVAVAPAVAMTIRQILALIPVMNMPHGIKVHAVVHGHTVIRVILAIMAVAAVVQNVLAVIQTVAAMVQVYPVAINRAPRHVHGRLARLMRPVPTAVHQPAADNITVVRVMLRLQHVQSAYLVNQDIIKAAAAVRPVAVINIIVLVGHARRYRLGIIQRAAHPPREQVKQHAVVINIIAPVGHARRYRLGIIPQVAHPPPEQVKQHAVVINIIAPVGHARQYHLDITQRAAHPPPEQVKRPVAVINIIAVAVCAIVYQQGIIQQVEALPPEQVKHNAPVQHIASVGLNMIVQNQLKMQISLLVIGIGHQMVFTIN